MTSITCCIGAKLGCVNSAGADDEEHPPKYRWNDRFVTVDAQRGPPLIVEDNEI